MKPLPCPFCGGQPRTHEKAYARHVERFVVCKVCRSRGPDRPTMDWAIEAWNRVAKAAQKGKKK